MQNREGSLASERVEDNLKEKEKKMETKSKNSFGSSWAELAGGSFELLDPYRVEGEMPIPSEAELESLRSLGHSENPSKTSGFRCGCNLRANESKLDHQKILGNSTRMELRGKDRLAGGKVRNGKEHCRRCAPWRFLRQKLREGVDKLSKLPWCYNFIYNLLTEILPLLKRTVFFNSFYLRRVKPFCFSALKYDCNFFEIRFAKVASRPSQRVAMERKVLPTPARKLWRH